MKPHRFYNSWVLLCISLGLICIYFLILGGTTFNTSWGEWVEFLFLIILSISFLIAGVLWIRLYFPVQHDMQCNTCFYDLHGHATDLSICPECGQNPKQKSKYVLWINELKQLPGCLMFFIGLFTLIISGISAALFSYRW